jgi:hypothetical protein
MPSPPDQDPDTPLPQRAGAGIVYSAAGELHVGEALASARSSLRHNRVPHVLFADRDVEAPAGLTVTRFQPCGNPYADKIINMRRSPFERTIYLDTDTYVVAEITHLLELLASYDVAAAHAPGYRGMPDPEVPAAFYELNTGVIAWRAGAAADAFLRDWEDTYVAWALDPPFPGAGGGSGKVGGASAARAGDQPAFRRCIWQHGMCLYVLGPEYNLRLGEPATVVAQVRLLHGRHSDYEALAARVNDRGGPRRWPRRPSLRERAVRALRRRGAVG